MIRANYIVLTTGLLHAANSHSALAFALAHESGHYIAEHDHKAALDAARHRALDPVDKGRTLFMLTLPVLAWVWKRN